MTRLRRLKVSALESAQWRKHKMGRFYRDSFWASKRHAECKACTMSLTVNTNPAPNEIDICGEAVALNCRIEGE